MQQNLNMAGTILLVLSGLIVATAILYWLYRAKTKSVETDA
jgi:hypothetical protein